MKSLALLSFLSLSSLGFVLFFVLREQGIIGAVYTDRHGTWRIPTNGWITNLTNKAIQTIPRVSSSKFSFVSPQFDLDNSEYIDSTVMYILLTGAVGVLFLLIVIIVFVAKYACKCCGGTRIPRAGYKQSSINVLRVFIIIFSFLLEGVLIYGYFANTDLHTSLSNLVTSFGEIYDQLTNLFNVIIDEVKKYEGDSVFQVTKESFLVDLNFSVKFAGRQVKQLASAYSTFESLRMALIIINLIAATIACSVGIAAGSVSKGTPVIVMIIMLSVSGALFFFSFGAHFSGSKMIFEFCQDVSSILDNPNDHDIMPLRLQFFVPCISSPLYPFIGDIFTMKAQNATNFFIDNLKDDPAYKASKEIQETLPYWFNISAKYYRDFINNNVTDESSRIKLGTILTNSINEIKPMSILAETQTCDWSKEQLRLERFQLCVYAKDNCDMLMVTQLCSAVLVVIITCLGFPAIKKFQWAGNANYRGVLNGGQKKVGGKQPRAKRDVK